MSTDALSQGTGMELAIAHMPRAKPITLVAVGTGITGICIAAAAYHLINGDMNIGILGLILTIEFAAIAALVLGVIMLRDVASHEIWQPTVLRMNSAATQTTAVLASQREADQRAEAIDALMRRTLARQEIMGSVMVEQAVVVGEIPAQLDGLAKGVEDIRATCGADLIELKQRQADMEAKLTTQIAGLSRELADLCAQPKPNLADEIGRYLAEHDGD